MSDPLYFVLYGLDLTWILDKALRTGVVDNHALPPFRQGHVAPWAASPARKLDVDKSALAKRVAPAAAGVLRRSGPIVESLQYVEAPESRGLSPFHPLLRDECGANRPGLPRIGMHDHLRAGNFRADEIDLRLHDGKVSVRAALKDKLAADLLQVGEATCVDPYIERQDGAEAGQDLLGMPTLALLVNDVALQEDAATHRQGRHRFRGKRAGSEFVHRDAEPFGDPLQKRAVAR